MGFWLCEPVRVWVGAEVVLIFCNACGKRLLAGLSTRVLIRNPGGDGAALLSGIASKMLTILSR
jgi:hypothetical protein